MSVFRVLAVRSASARYAGRPEHIQDVRVDLRELLKDCPMADDAILCASELATNAVVHSRSGLPGGSFSVRAALSRAEGVVIEVQDQGGIWGQGERDLQRPHGLDVIDLLATDWGIIGEHHSRTVWIRIGWPSGRTAMPDGSGEQQVQSPAELSCSEVGHGLRPTPARPRYMAGSSEASPSELGRHSGM